MKKLLSSYHLDGTREALFEVVRLSIEDSRGENTIWLEDLAVANNSKELSYLKGNIKQIGEDSNYSVSIGLNTCKLKYGANRIGRFEDNDIVIEDKAISRRHCCIVVHSDEKMEIFDTASRNGTRVNGQKIQKCFLRPGDEISQILTLSRRTIEAHRARIMLKLNMHDLPVLVKYSIINQLTSIDKHRSDPRLA